MSAIHEVVTPQEAAALLGMTERQIRNLCAAGKLEARQAGATWLILRSSLERRAPTH